MSYLILWWSLITAQILIGMAMVLAMRRMFIGPRAQDKVLGLDSLYVGGMLQLLLFGMRAGENTYFIAALVTGVIGFVSTAALAKFLMRGEVIE